VAIAAEIRRLARADRLMGGDKSAGSAERMTPASSGAAKTRLIGANFAKFSWHGRARKKYEEVRFAVDSLQISAKTASRAN